MHEKTFQTDYEFMSDADMKAAGWPEFPSCNRDLRSRILMLIQIDGPPLRLQSSPCSATKEEDQRRPSLLCLSPRLGEAACLGLGGSSRTN